MAPGVQNDRIRCYGGPLQTYLNLEGLDVARETHLAFGATAIFPVHHWRLELFGGMGGVDAAFQTQYAMTNSWSVDRGQHFRIGTTASYITDLANKNRQG